MVEEEEDVAAFDYLATIPDDTQITVDSSNLQDLYEYWVSFVCVTEGNHAHQINDFLTFIVDPEQINTDQGQYNVDCLDEFKTKVKCGYSAQEASSFYEMKDTLLEERSRRFQGAFYTPVLWAQEAQKTLDAVLGSTWKEDCLVWDPAAGTANLTRDFVFKDLILSTLEKSDVDNIKEQGYNPDAFVFQLDFLNITEPSVLSSSHSIPAEVEAHLRQSAKAGKKLVWLMNPPYGTAGNMKGSQNKTGIANTKASELSRDLDFGNAARQLYAQFMVQANELAKEYGFRDVVVAIFSKSTHMSAGSFRNFRQYWHSRYQMADGFLFNAGHFGGVRSTWGVSFMVWVQGSQTGDVKLTLKDEIAGEIKDIGTKVLYCRDDTGTKWASLGHKMEKADLPLFSSGLKVCEGPRYNISPETLYFFGGATNCMGASSQTVYLLSLGAKQKRGFSVLAENWRRASTLYAVKKVVPSNWVLDKDEYGQPTESLPGYEQWADDCHIYTMAHSGNNCTAMRNVPYKGTLWRIKNHWFWRTRAEAVKALAPYPDLLRDAQEEPVDMNDDLFGLRTDHDWKVDGDPYFSLDLPNLKLGPEAVKVLSLIDALWLKSLPQREAYADTRKDLHLKTWDAGLYQLKHFWRDCYPEDWAEIMVAYRELAKRIRPGAYEYDFLRHPIEGKA